MTAVPTLLVVDDDPTNLAVASDLLKEYAYRVLTALDGDTGVRRARAAQPDLILLDIQMPGIDGYEACRRLKANPRTAEIPVIFATALSGTQDTLRAFELGGVDYVTKPFVPAVLLARVRTHLTLARQRRELAEHAQDLDARVTQATAALQQEAGRLQAALGERDRIVQLLELQSEQLRHLTRRWVDDRSQDDRDLARYLRASLIERLHLVQGELAHAAHHVDEGPAAEHLARAQALLEPAVASSEAVEQRVLQPDALAENPLLRLSARELEVFKLLVSGKSNKEIAGALDVGRTTVSTYRSRILEKLEVDDVPALVRLSVRFDVG